MGELIYTLSEELRKDQTLLIVTIEEERGAKRILYKDSLLGLAREKDKEIIQLLIKEELRFLGLNVLSSQADTLPFNRIHILASRSNALLRPLSATGQLFFQGKRILFDPFTRLEFYYEATDQEEKGLVVEGKWKGGERIGSVDWAFPGDPIWAIRDGGVLQFLAAQIDWKWVEMVSAGPKCLEGVKKRQFIDQFEDGDYPKAPKVVWKKPPSAQEIVEQKSLPFLVLQDRSGGFADLWIDYGAQGKVALHDPKVAPWRNFKVEKEWEKDLLETDFIKKMVGTSQYYCPLDKVAKSLTFLLELGWEIYDAQKRRVCRQSGQQLALQMDLEKITISGKISYEDHRTDLANLVGAFNRRERFIDLSPNTVGLIDPHTMDEWGDLEGAEVLATGVAIKKSHFGTLEPLFKQQGITCDPLVDRLRKSGEISEALPSNSFRATLYPYQQEGVNWLSFLHASGLHGLLADEMGLGKTVQVLAFLSRLESPLPILIIAPTSLLFHWRREIETFLPGREVYVHSGTKRFQDPDFLKEQRIVLTSYALVRQDIDLLNAVSWEAIILDEAQSIKNPDSLAAKCIRALGGKFRLAITGTPVENRPDDLWSLFAFLVPELLGDRPQFNAKIEAAALDERHLHRLKRKLRPFLLQRRKSEVALQLPPKIEQVVWVEMEEEQKTLYEEWMAAQRRGLLKKVKEEGVAAHRMEVLEAILRLRQICCAPQLVDAEKTISSAKLERVLSDLEEVIAKKSKVLIYSQFTQMLHLIEKEIIQRGWRFVSLDGSTKNREQVVTAFQEDPEISIFLISLKAGGVGLNLTAADYIFLYDPWWNEAVENQAIDRAHRVGREGAVIARRYLTANSIEEKMVRLKESKSALSKGLLSFEETLHQITLNDLCALLED